MAIEGIVDAVADLVVFVGLPLLIGLFFLEGLVLGKILQAPAVFVTVVALTTPSGPFMAGLIGGCTIAVTLGQWTVFRSFDPDDERSVAGWTRSPRLQWLADAVVDRIGQRRLALAERWFVRYGALAIFVSTFLPLVRGTVAVPAGMSAYPRGPFVAVTLGANVTYFGLLTAIAFELLRVLGA